ALGNGHVALAAELERGQLDVERLAVLLSRAQPDLPKVEGGHGATVALRRGEAAPTSICVADRERYEQFAHETTRPSMRRTFWWRANSSNSRGSQRTGNGADKRRLEGSGAVVVELDRPDASDDCLLRALVEAVAAAAHRGEELVQVRFE